MTLTERDRAEKVQAALYRISESAQATEDLGELYKLIHSIIAQLMSAENFYIALYDPAADLIIFPYYADEFDSNPPPQKPGRGLTEYVLRSGLPLLATPEIYNHLLENGQVELIGADSVDWLGVPLKTPTNIIGMMAVQTYTPQVRYSQADQDILSFISTQVAMVIERKRVEATLRENEQRYRLLFENAPLGILLANPQGEIVDVNPTTLHILGSPSVEATKAINILTFPPLIQMGFAADIQRCIETGQSIVAEHPYTSKWGKSIFIQYYVTPILDEARRVILVQVMFEDITERKQAEGQIRNLNRMLQVISQANEALVRAVDEGELMQRVCQILVEVGGYRLAWIGLASQDAAKTVHPVAVAGFDSDYVDRVDITWVNTKRGLGPTGTAIRTGLPVLVQDILTDPHYGLWRESAHAHGYAASIALPLLTHGQALGAINVYASQAGAFNGEEVKLLVEMANDLAYGIMALRELSIRQQAEEALRNSEEKFSTAFRISPDAINIHRLSDGMYLEINDGFTSMTGYTAGDVKGKTSLELNIWVNPSDMERLIAGLQARGQVNNLETSFRMKDGQVRTGLMSARIIQIGSETCILSITRDITELKQAELERAQRLVELEAVNQLSTTLRTAQNLSEMLPRLLAETLRLMNTQAGAIWLYDALSEELRSEVAQGWFDQMGTIPMKPGEGIGGKVFATGEPHFSTEYTADPCSRQAVRAQIPKGWGGVCVPIQTAAETIGVFYVAVQLPREFKPEEVRLLTTLVEIAGNAIHRMRLHAQTELHVQRLSALRTVDMTITASLDLRVTLDVLLEQVISQLGADAADVLLLNEHTQTLETMIGRGFRRNSLLRSRLRLGEEHAGRVALERRIIRVSYPDIVKIAPSQAIGLIGEEFKTYYGVPLIAKGKVKGVLELFHRAPFTPDPEWLDFLETLAGQAAIAIEDAQLFDYLQRVNTELMVAYDSTIEGWSRALELRDQETEGHTRRVAEMTLELARAMQVFNEESLVHIRRGALLHDIGKMGVPDEILLKPGPLTKEEWSIMRKHSEYAYDLLRPIDYLRPALDIPYYHHERWDGAGYPQGLKGEQIPLEARIFAVVDVWDALTSNRPYSRAWKPDQARDYILAQSGSQFDPQVVAVFLKLLETGVFQ
jgi:PAS domain S-box-containing protein/putative nucleotidyltransferase with HDIG domain